MSLLNSKFDILRGWPDGSACVEELTVLVADKAKATAGKWVTLDAAAANYQISDAAASTGKVTCFLVLEGTEESSSGASDAIGTNLHCTVLLGGGYVVRLENKAADSEMFLNVGVNMTPGLAVRVNGGIISGAAAVDEDNCVGFVLATNLTGNLGTIDVYIDI